MSSSRMSFGGARSVLRDGGARLNSRRKSLGGNSYESMEPTKPDARSALEDWRRNQAAARGRDEQEQPESNKRIKVQESPSLPPVGYSTTPSKQQGTSALERWRMQKQAKQLMQQQSFSSSDDNGLLPPHPPPVASRSTICFDYGDDFNDDGVGSSSLLSSGTPSFRRRLGSTTSKSRRNSIAGGAAAPRFRASPSLSQETYPPAHSHSHSLSQLTTASAPTPTTNSSPSEDFDLVEGAGLRSRVLEMQQRVDQLEKEKMVLSMAKAPLEARFRKAEDEWLKEQNRLLQEIDSLKQASRETDERYRDLLVKYDALQEESKQLRFAARKAASSLNSQSSSDSSIFTRQLQNDREVAELKEKLRHADEEIKALRLEKVSVEKEINATNMELDSLIRSYDELQAEYDELAASSSENREAEIKLEVLSTEHIATSAQLNAVCSDLAATKARAEAVMEAKEEQHKKEIAQLQFDMSVLKTRAAKVVDDDEKTALETDEEDEAVLRARIEERDRRIIELEAELLKGEQIRRQMHNRIQELRGNIRVFVRTRPFLPGDGENLDSSIDVSPDGENLTIIDHRSGNPAGFKFDKVFPASAGQDLVFNEVSDFVQSALDGYHVCLFSYGQTGSGKTHTMQGSGNGAMRGIIPRAVEQILAQAQVLQNQKWDFTMSASFLEIYNEELKDLLVNMKNDGKPAPPNAKGAKLAIKRNREGKSFVDGLTEIKIDTVDADTGMQQLAMLMNAAARARSVASTKMNAHSSRSHSVFMLHLHGYNEDSGASVHGALNLCDLAGSERLDRSGAGADAKRLKETQSINKSLSCLGDVFNALATGASHVPYRNSKLTYLLQDCLSGDGKALMFVNLSPTYASSNESLCSLRFAQRVNQVELGKPIKHIEYGASGRAKQN